MFFDETKKPQGFKGREALPTFKDTLTLTQLKHNRYQKNARLTNFPVMGVLFGVGPHKVFEFNEFHLKNRASIRLKGLFCLRN
jgi:hypothetical protein